MRWWTLVVLAVGGCVAGGVTGCGSSTCPSLAGSWQVTAHCDSSAVGTVWALTQNGCGLSVPEINFTGVVDADGMVSLQGTPSPEAGFQDCSGTSSAAAINMQCNETCGVSLVRR
ncbi:MAG: hypothetical protein K8H88_26650 [Sandaracinaceae bacterium]|nr:hypothetical protein [Sandaracinaceae bacterium]